MFEVATRAKYRFPFRGQISVEDLWDLNRSQLDTVYQALNADKKASENDSLIAERTSEDEELTNKIAIVRYIFGKKQEEAEAKKRKAENAAKKRQLMDIIASKEQAALGEKSIDDLRKMLEEMD